MAQAEQSFNGYDINGLISEWQAASQQKGAPPRYPDKAFLGWAEKYVENHPLEVEHSVAGESNEDHKFQHSISKAPEWGE